MLDFFDAVPLLALERLLKDVAHVCTQRVRVAVLDGGEHRVRIRTVGDRHAVYAREERGCGDREVRLADGDEEARCGLEDGQLFAAALGQLRAAADAEGNVAADTRTDLLEPLVRERGGDKIAQCAQHRRCVRAAAGHTGFGRDALDKRDVDAAAVVHGLAEGLCRLDGEVAFIARQFCIRDAAGNTLVRERNGHIVVERDGLHDHFHLVVAVIALAENVERQVELGVGGNAYAAHGLLRRRVERLAAVGAVGNAIAYASERPAAVRAAVVKCPDHDGKEHDRDAENDERYADACANAAEQCAGKQQRCLEFLNPAIIHQGLFAIHCGLLLRSVFLFLVLNFLLLFGLRLVGDPRAAVRAALRCAAAKVFAALGTAVKAPPDDERSAHHHKTDECGDIVLKSPCADEGDQRAAPKQYVLPDPGCFQIHNESS